MNRLRNTSFTVFFIIFIVSYSGKAQTPLLYETFGDFSTKVTEAAAVNTDFNNGTVVVYPKNLSSTQQLGQKSNSAILTDDISAFSASFSNPSSYDDNYLVVEPGDGSPGQTTPATPDPFLANYVSSLVWSETISSGFASGDLLDFNMRAVKLFPSGTTQAVYSPKASVRVIARTISGNTTMDEILVDELLNNLTSDFTFMKNYGFQLFATSVEIRVELVYQDGDMIALGVDDIYFGKSQLFQMNTLEYCVNDPLDMTGGCSWTNCSYNVLHDGSSTSPSNFNDFSSFPLSSPGEYVFEMTATSSTLFEKGAEKTLTLTESATVLVYAKPTILSGFSSAFDAKQMGDLQYAFTNRVEPGDGIGFNWIFDDGTTSTKPHPSHIFDESKAINDRFNVRLEAYNVLPTCSIDHPETIEICTANNRPTFGFTANEDPVNKTVDVQGISGGFAEYIWTYGDGQSGETKTTNANFTINYTELGKYVIRGRVQSGVCAVEHEEVVQLCETIIPSVDENDCGDQFTFSVSSSEYNSLKWWRKPVELSTQSPFVYSPVAKQEKIWAVIDNGCEITETLFVLEPKGPPHSDFMAVPKGGNLDMWPMRFAANTTYNWTVKAYDESNLLLETLTYNNTSPASYPIHGSAVSVEVSLNAISDLNSNCHSTAERTICIPSSTHDCCETCSGS